jgi:hypothetical protein
MSCKENQTSKKPAVSQKLDRQVNFYAGAAAAAGVSILAMVQPAQGEVIITKKTIPIPISNFDGQQFPVPIDFNRDGVTDLSFILSTFAYHSFNGILVALPATGGAVVAAPGAKDNFYASALLRGAKVGPSAHFSSKGVADLERSQGGESGSSRYSRNIYGKWNSGSPNRYLGVRFLINGQTHYGWVRMTVAFGTRRPIAATITAYAYETVANKKIFAGIAETTASTTQVPELPQKRGQPSLGMLASGSDGIAIWRREH